ncbi:RIP metalloprotease RseP [Halotalea alkalilenta]|uniref:RIP metalloprotease RseP n=1 Tax=Halotalea alkalilenta TaxID=376489 RepID=UPI000486E5C6|nr:RIP metalloprotease RseP [Halotalea alkalilenta]
MSALQNILAVIVVLGVLITIHEFGHFWVARRCGVKVLRFSVGFGKPLWSRTDRHGTEFQIAAIPLGGYVKMLDEREGNVPEEELHRAFNRKSVYRRIAIVAAGPVANFLLAIVAYWALFIYGTSVVAPVVGTVAPGSPAELGGLRGGEEIVRVEGHPTPSWQEVSLKLIGEIGRNGSLLIDTADGGEHRLPVQAYMVRQDPPSPLETLGITPWQPPIEARLGQVLADGPAAQAGLETGDRVLAVDGEPIDDWNVLVERVRASSGRTLSLDVESQAGVQRSIELTPQPRELDGGETIGYIGAAAVAPEWPAEYLREIRYSPFAALPQAVGKTWEMTWLTVDSIRKMVVGLISPSNLSGPVTIARVAGDSARSGVETFVGFLAYLSISLGVLNLLPIPVLDGGHLLYFIIEAVRGRPVSERVQLAGLKVGVVLIGTLMVMALYFDLLRL